MSENIKVYVYPFPLTSNDHLTDGPKSIGNPAYKLFNDTLLIWVDLMPEARFSHPTAYIFISGQNTWIEKGGWWPVLNGKQILYGQKNPVGILSPFDLETEALNLAKKLDDEKSLAASYVSGMAPEKIYSVEFIDFKILKSNPPKLWIDATGIANTPGWKNPRLEPYIYIQPPPDGIWEFDFVADRPTGIVPQILTPIETSYLYEGDFSKWKGVRIGAQTNTKERLLGEPKAVESSGHNVIELPD